jgi:hypothetical protein
MGSPDAGWTVEFAPENPMRPPNWRWQRARYLAERGLEIPARTEGPWIRRAFRFHQVVLKYGPQEALERIVKWRPELLFAYQLWTTQQMARDIVEACILSGQTSLQIAWKLCIQIESLDAYAELFYDVRGKLRHRGYVHAMLIGPELSGPLSRVTFPAVLKTYAYNMGPHVLDALLGVYNTSVAPLEAEGISLALPPMTHLEVTVKAAVAAKLIPVNQRTAPHLLRLFARIVEMEARLKDQPDAEEECDAPLRKCWLDSREDLPTLSIQSPPGSNSSSVPRRGLPPETIGNPTARCGFTSGKESQMQKPASDFSDETPFVPRPARPTLLDRREPLVEQGDFGEIYRQLLQTPWHETKPSDAFWQLFRAIDVASRKDPAALSAELFRMMLNIAGYLTLRVQYTLLQRSNSMDSGNYNGRTALPSDVLESVSGDLMSMQSHLAELCQSQAASARLWQLARQKELENHERLFRGRDRRLLKGGNNERRRLNGQADSPTVGDDAPSCATACSCKGRDQHQGEDES